MLDIDGMIPIISVKFINVVINLHNVIMKQNVYKQAIYGYNKTKFVWLKVVKIYLIYVIQNISAKIINTIGNKKMAYV